MEESHYAMSRTAMATAAEPPVISINLRARRATSTKVSFEDKSAPDISTDGLARVCLV